MTTNMSRRSAATATAPDHADHSPVRRARRGRALAVLGAAAAALAVWTAAVPVAGIRLTVRMNGVSQPVGPAAVITTSLLAGLAGWALLAGLERRRRARRGWTAAAVAVLALSLAGPLGSGENTATRVALAGMHLAVGAVLIPGLRRTARADVPSDSAA